MLHCISTTLITGTLLLSPLAYAQEPNAMPTDDHTAREEEEGREIWGKMQREKADCGDLSDDQFAALGEFFMGEMTGDAHEAMNDMMARMIGEEGEEQMHVVMGKRMSGCGGDGTLPVGNTGMMRMMPMMGRWSNGYAPDMMSPMMGYGFGFAPFGFLFMIFWWGLIIVAVVALVRWLSRTYGTQSGKSPLDILKERYAKGEINKQEFEERKKDLS